MEKSKKEKIIIDIHSHLLPYLDDGAKDENDLNSILELYRREGVEGIIATPHIRVGRYDNGYGLVEEAIGKHGLEDRVFPGQEVFLDNQTLSLCKKGAVKGINGGDHLLVELSMWCPKENLLSHIFELQNMGFKPVIAHPERYGCILEEPWLMNDLISSGCSFQVNSASIEGLLGPKVKKFVEVMARSGLVDFLGSDCHNTRSRAPRLREAMVILDSMNQGLGDVVQRNAQSLIAGGELVKQERMLMSKKVSFFNFWNRRSL